MEGGGPAKLRYRRGTVAVSAVDIGAIDNTSNEHERCQQLPRLAAACAALAQEHVSPEWREAAIERDGLDEWHITILGPSEAKLSTCRDRVKALVSDGADAIITDDNLTVLGCGRSASAAFAVVHSSHLQSLRFELGLEHKDLHVTLGFAGRDDHSTPKGPQTLLPLTTAAATAAAAGLTRDLENLRTLPRTHQPALLARLQAAAEAVAAAAPGDAAETACAACFAVALKAAFLRGSRAPTGDVDRLTNKLKDCDPIEATYLVARHAVGRAAKASDPAVAAAAAAAVHDALTRLAAGATAPTVDDPRVQWLILAAQPAVAIDVSSGRRRAWGGAPGDSSSLTLLPLPLNSAPVPGVESSAGEGRLGALWGSGCPSAKTVPGMLALGVRRVVTLTEEPLAAEVREALEAGGATAWHRPWHDRCPPRSAAALAEAARLAQRGLMGAGGRVWVHCAGGKGRTALLLAAVLVLEQRCSPSQAMERVRGNSRITLVTPQQIAALRELHAAIIGTVALAPFDLSHLALEPRADRPVPAAEQCARGQHQRGAGGASGVLPRALPRVIVLCGLPGAGKSTFSARLAGSLPAGSVVHVNQDRLGGRATKDVWSSAAAAATRSCGKSTTAPVVAVLDKCHATRAQRAAAVALAGVCAAPTLVYFARPAGGEHGCAARACARRAHPGRVEGARAGRVVAAVAAAFEPPAAVPPEPGFAAVHVVASDAESDRLLARWGLRPPAAEDVLDHPSSQGATEPLHKLADIVKFDELAEEEEEGRGAPDHNNNNHVRGDAFDTSDDDNTCCRSSSSTGWSLPPLLKFPRTPHLLDLGAATRDDLKVSADAGNTPEAWLSAHAAHAGAAAVVEEKVDGANMGLRWAPGALSASYGGILEEEAAGSSDIVAQNRSHYVNAASHAQFRRLGAFIAAAGPELRRRTLRDPNLILYGEWVQSRHSVSYDALPSYFVAFDLRCALTGTFASRAELELALEGTGVAIAPLLLRRPLARDPLSARRDIVPLVHRQSTFSASGEPAEGVYVRVEREGLTVSRAKVVRPGFIAGGGEDGAARWNRGALVNNSLRRVLGAAHDVNNADEEDRRG